MKDYIAEFAKSYTNAACLSLLLDPCSADEQIARDTDWLARRLSGLADAPAERCGGVGEKAVM